MTDTKHTPGPSEIRCQCADRLDVAQHTRSCIHNPKNPSHCDDDRCSGRTVHHPDCFRRRAEMRARLIAAAPELLAALEDIASGLEAEGYFPGLVKRARAAIARARGESK